MPDAFLRRATGAAAQAGFSEYVPDACLINRYEPGARLSLHQDKNEHDFDQPTVFVSLGIPAVFLGFSGNGVGKCVVCHCAIRMVGALLAAPVFG